ncbi:hypothetical protein RvY_12279 [Ramazzottius varieornatus]|uniref:Uncharacterized protein n=1 Tax=Ramazzottius varieornatus TaxID=947166 RepID=A0A1D1VKZ0_RAMVA|nr:hypothetical protein RvY_12279 [Ramazzottius varieornatus]
MVVGVMIAVAWRRGLKRDAAMEPVSVKTCTPGFLIDKLASRRPQGLHGVMRCGGVCGHGHG